MSQKDDSILRIFELYFVLKGGLILVGIILYMIGIPTPSFISFLFEDLQLYRLTLLLPVLMSIGYFYSAYGIANRLNVGRIIAIVLTIPSLFFFPIGTIVALIIIGYLVTPRASEYFEVSKKKAPFRMIGAIVMIVGVFGILYSIGIVENLAISSESYFAGMGSLSITEKMDEDVDDGSRMSDIIIVLTNPVGKSTFSQQSVNIQQNAMIQTVTTLGGEVTGSVNRVFNAMRVSIESSDLMQLASDPNVASIVAVEKVVWITESQFTMMLDNSYSVIKADSLWAQGITGEGIVVAIVDTGINEDIPQLRRDGQSIVIDSYELYGDWTHWHGTACATCIAGQDETYKGIAPGASLIDVQVFQADGGAYNWDILEGWNWLTQWKEQNDRFVICSNSFGGPGIDQILNEAANNMVRLYNIPMAVAAGNEGPGAGSVTCPGNAADVLTIGAVNDNKLIAEFSGRGPTIEGIDKPDVCAPGVNINMFDDQGNLIKKSGTSFATPIAAGAMALIAQDHELYSSEQIQKAMMNGAEDQGSIGYDYNYGYGVIQLEDSLSWIKGETPAKAYSYLFFILLFLGLAVVFYPEYSKKIKAA